MRMRLPVLGTLLLVTAVLAGCGAPAQPTADSSAASLLDSFPDTAAPTTTAAKTRPLPAGCSVVTEGDLKGVLGLSGFTKQEGSEPESDGMASTNCEYSVISPQYSLDITVLADDITTQDGEYMETALDGAFPCSAANRVSVPGVWDAGTRCGTSLAVASQLGVDVRLLTIVVSDTGGSGIPWQVKLSNLAALAFPRLLS